MKTISFHTSSKPRIRNFFTDDLMRVSNCLRFIFNSRFSCSLIELAFSLIIAVIFCISFKLFLKVQQC